MKEGTHFGNLGPALKRVLQRAGLGNVRVHDLRRTVGCWLAHAGHTLHLIGDVLNHRDLETTAGYAYFQTQQRRDALTGHGNRVLSFAAAQLRIQTAPQALSVDDVLRPDGSPARHRHYFKREALYELVWTAPVSEVANRLGVSNVGLAKLCQRAAIPMPRRGYWARVEAGQKIPRLALPPTPDDVPNPLRIRGTATSPRLQ